MFSNSFRKYRDGEKKKTTCSLLSLLRQTARAILSQNRSTVLNQACVLALSYFIKIYIYILQFQQQRFWN